MLLIICIVFFTSIIIILNNKINKYYENNVINIVLSRLNYNPRHYNIFKINNKIYIKSHYYYINNLSNISSDIIKYNKYYYIEEFNIITGDINQIKLFNINPDKVISIISSKIIIDLNTKHYEIIYYKFNIITLITDIRNYYTKIIKYLENPCYYIDINNDDITINNLSIYYIFNNKKISNEIHIKPHIDNLIINNISNTLI